jgi:hypothetical protein
MQMRGLIFGFQFSVRKPLLLKTENRKLKTLSTVLPGGPMKTTLLIILLTHQGYWLGGHDEAISVQWAVDQKIPPANLQWEVMFDHVRLAGDQIKMPGHDSAVIKLQIPPVRVRTQMQWVYRVTAVDGGQELASGQQLLNVFPPISLDSTAPRMLAKKIFVADDPDGLPSVLAAAKIHITRIGDVDQLQLAQADLILVAANQLTNSPFAQYRLIEQAKAGAQVLILQQTKLVSLCGYALARRSVPPRLAWREEHPLFAFLDENDLQSWIEGASADLWAMLLPADAPVLELAYWPREIPGKDPAPIDALVAVQAVGKGRIVFCQLPLGSWNDDPRSRIFLVNALNYMLTRPEPIPPPSQRCITLPAKVVPVPTIKIPPGETP